MSNLKALETKAERKRKDSKRTLLDALGEEFESVVVVGFRSDGSMRTMFSAGLAYVKTIGGLACAQSDLIVASKLDEDEDEDKFPTAS